MMDVFPASGGAFRDAIFDRRGDRRRSLEYPFELAVDGVMVMAKP